MVQTCLGPGYCKKATHIHARFLRFFTDSFPFSSKSIRFFNTVKRTIQITLKTYTISHDPLQVVALCIPMKRAPLCRLGILCSTLTTWTAPTSLTLTPNNTSSWPLILTPSELKVTVAKMGWCHICLVQAVVKMHLISLLQSHLSRVKTFTSSPHGGAFCRIAWFDVGNKYL